jgi:hypothetical protein
MKTNRTSDNCHPGRSGRDRLPNVPSWKIICFASSSLGIIPAVCFVHHARVEQPVRNELRFVQSAEVSRFAELQDDSGLLADQAIAGGGGDDLQDTTEAPQ